MNKIGSYSVVLFVITIILLLIIPLPAALVDVAIILNMSLSMMILVITMTIFHFPLSAADYHAVPSGNQRVFHKKYSEQQWFFRKGHRSVW